MRCLPLALLVACGGFLYQHPDTDYRDALEQAVEAYQAAEGPVSMGCIDLAAELNVVVLPRAEVELYCLGPGMYFCPGMGACIGLFDDGWRAYVAEDNVHVDGSVAHELLHLLPWCEGHPLGLDHGHEGGWW